MKKTISHYLKTVLAVSGIVVLSFASTPIASATGVNVFAGCSNGGGSSTGNTPAQGTPAQPGQGTGQGQGNGSSGTGSSSICGATSAGDFTALIKNVVNILLVALGMIAVIMIIIGGVRYTTSNGDSGQVKSAKDTIMYAVVGLVVAIMAYAIVNFVLGFFH